MKICFVAPIFQQENSGFRQSGGEISNRVLIEGLAERHDVSVLALLGSCGESDLSGDHLLPYSYEWLFPPKSQPFITRMLAIRKLRARLIDHVSSCKPDIIIAATSAMSMALEVGKSFEIPVVVLVRAFEHGVTSRSIYQQLRNVAKRIQWGDYSSRRFPECATVIYNSEFLAGWYTDRVGEHPRAIVYPPLDIVERDERWNGTTGRVLMIGTSRLKGIDVALDMAQLDPGRTYIVAGGDSGSWGETAPSNVRFIGWQDDRASLYGAADVVIVPSRWEALGRVPIEALLHGKAVLVSDKGGLPEAVGHTQALIVKSHNAAEWLDRLNWLGENGVEASESIESARSMTVRFRREVQLDRFEEILENLVRGHDRPRSYLLSGAL